MIPKRILKSGKSLYIQMIDTSWRSNVMQSSLFQQLDGLTSWLSQKLPWWCLLLLQKLAEIDLQRWNPTYDSLQCICSYYHVYLKFRKSQECWPFFIILQLGSRLQVTREDLFANNAYTCHILLYSICKNDEPAPWGCVELLLIFICDPSDQPKKGTDRKRTDMVSNVHLWPPFSRTTYLYLLTLIDFSKPQGCLSLSWLEIRGSSL